MPREVAEWEVARRREQAESVPRAEAAFLADLHRLPALEIVARLMAAARSPLGVPGVELPDPPGGRDSRERRRPAPATLIGTIPLGDDYALALHGNGDPTAPIEPGTLLLRHDREWRVLTPEYRTPPHAGGEGVAAMAEDMARLRRDALAATPEIRPAAGGPGDVVARAAAALHDRDWRAAAGFVNTDRLEHWFAVSLRSARRSEERTRPADPARAATAERLMAEDPTLPEFVARYRAERMQRALEEAEARPHAELGPLYSLTADELTALGPVDAFALLLETADLGERISRQLRALGPEMAAALDRDGLSAAGMQRPRNRVLGPLVTGSVGFVAFASTGGLLGDSTAVSFHAAVLKRTDAGWRLDPFSWMFQWGETVMLGPVGRVPPSPPDGGP